MFDARTSQASTDPRVHPPPLHTQRKSGLRGAPCVLEHSRRNSHLASALVRPMLIISYSSLLYPHAHTAQERIVGCALRSGAFAEAECARAMAWVTQCQRYSRDDRSALVCLRWCLFDVCSTGGCACMHALLGGRVTMWAYAFSDIGVKAMGRTLA